MLKGARQRKKGERTHPPKKSDSAARCSTWDTSPVSCIATRTFQNQYQNVMYLALQIVHAQEILKHNMLHRAGGKINVIVSDNDFSHGLVQFVE